MSFFPKLSRCETYDVKECGGFYGYAHYRDQISIDCQNRCVYCDVRIDENGNEGFALDHFRPQEKFPDLKNVPDNLVISCAKCNRSKSSHWPISIDLAEAHNDVVGFVDPFLDDRLSFFSVSGTGEFIALRGPSEYIIKLLSLNRPSRVSIRRNRMLNLRIDDLLSLAEKILVEIIEMGNIDEGSFDKLRFAKNIVGSVRQLREEILSIK